MSHYKPYPAYKDSGVEWIGKVPEGWRETRLKFLGDYLNGYPFKPNEWAKSGLPIIRIAQLTGQEFDNYYDGDVPEHLKIKDGDLLFSWSATIDCFIWDRGDAWLNQHIFKVIPSAEAYKRYLFHLIRHIAPKLADFDAHGSTMRHIKKESLSEKVFVPSIVEQERVAKAIDRETSRIDALIAKKTRFIELLQEKRQALITHAVTKGLDPNVKMKDSGVEWIGEVPEHWDVARVKHVSRQESGHTPDKKNPDFWEDCQIPWVSLKDSDTLRNVDYIHDTDTCINERGLAGSSARILPRGTVVFTRDATVGLCAITARPMAVSQHVIGWVSTGHLNPEFLLRVFEAMATWLDSLTVGATIKTIGMDDVGILTTPYPPMAEQVTIAAHIQTTKTSMARLIGLAERSITLLKERRSALITAAVTGKIDLASGDNA